MRNKTKTRPAEASGPASAMRGLSGSFAMLAERAGDERPLLRVAHHPTADRIVTVHSGLRVEFVLVPVVGEPPCADVDCRRMGSQGATEATPTARVQFDEAGNVSQSSVPELVNETIAQPNRAWSIVGAVIWSAMHGPG